MELENGMRVLIRGRYSDFTDHLDGQVVTVVNSTIDNQGYIKVQDDEGGCWYVQAIDVFPHES